MDVVELRSNIKQIADMISDQMPKVEPAEQKIGAIVLVGIWVFGELLVDIKRLADATERGQSSI